MCYLLRTKLPTQDSAGYEERLRFAQKQADEIERSDIYQKRIAKEVTDDGDEESKFSSVHRGEENHSSNRSHDNASKNTYVVVF